MSNLKKVQAEKKQENTLETRIASAQKIAKAVKNRAYLIQKKEYLTELLKDAGEEMKSDIFENDNRGSKISIKIESGYNEVFTIAKNSLVNEFIEFLVLRIGDKIEDFEKVILK